MVVLLVVFLSEPSSTSFAKAAGFLCYHCTVDTTISIPQSQTTIGDASLCGKVREVQHFWPRIGILQRPPFSIS